ncbi:MAG TPA: hypothetical protein VKE41_03900 [Roseiflexaceae bacterium]|nr:hypothetical protein [Roseiflexaceae bacterium]
MRKFVFLIGCLALAACGQSAPAAAPTSAPAATSIGSPSAAATSAPTAAPQPTAAPAPTAAQPTPSTASTSAGQASSGQGAAPSEPPKPGQSGGTSIAPPQELVNAAQQQLALHLKTNPADLPLQSANAKEWPDGALGCPQEGHAYPQVITPGFVLIFTDPAQSARYEVHTARSAAQMLLCQNGQPIDLSVKPAAAAPSAETAPDAEGARLGKLARAALAQEQGLAERDITVAAVEATEWRDSSLGCPKPGMNYLQVITPGYKITMEAQGKRYEYHTDTNQRVVRCDQP